MEISIQRQAADDAIRPSWKAGAKLLPVPEGESVITIELEVVSTVKVKMTPVGVRIDLKVTTTAYTERI